MTDRPRHADRSLMSHYAGQARNGRLVDDAGQRAVLEALDRLRARLEHPAPRPRHGRMATDGAYIWGDVGRGKTMVMDLFFAQAALTEKRRVHFDAFMRDLHAARHATHGDGRADAIGVAIRRMAGGVRLLALDELQVRDAADSTLLCRVFGDLLAAGVTIVATSNTPPTELYRADAKRDVFQPLIDLLTARLAVHHLGGPVDYRQRAAGTEAEAAKNYVFPNDARAKAALDRIWTDLVGDRAKPGAVRVLGREFVLPAHHDGMARMTFDHACAAPRGPADYIALCAGLRVLMLDDVPRLSMDRHDVARRFIMLVDAAYEARVRLILSAEVAAERLYPEGDGALSFRRLISRLSEMQTWDQPGQGPGGQQDGVS